MKRGATGREWLRIIAFFGIVICAASIIAAESGTISGVIKDASGTAIAGVKVTAESAGGLRRDTTTDSKGTYRFADLPTGIYRVTAAIAGFQSARYTSVELLNGKSLKYDFKLAAGGATEVVELGSTPQPGKLEVPALRPGVVAQDVIDVPRETRKVEGSAAVARKIPEPLVDCVTCLTSGGVSGGVVGGVIGGVKGGVLGGTLGGVLGGSISAPPPPPLPSPIRVGGGSVSGIATVIASNGASVGTSGENPFVSVLDTQLSTFAVDVDTASYANVRRFITQNQRPPKEFVRIEELVNYFSYDYPMGSGADPITGNVEVAAAPWNTEHRLVRVGVRAKPVSRTGKAANLVFLIDVSGSMNTPERLPLLKSGLKMFVDRLTESDMVSIVTYAGAAGVALQPVSGDRKDTILQAIENLRADGSTNGGAGIQTAYDMAVANFIPGGLNRVVLATDGDFNVGVTDQTELVRLIESRAKSSVFLTVLGFGKNFKDALLEKLADKGNGNYAFIDSLNEARKVLLEQMDATLLTVAKDVKIQVEFNPERVAAYRLIGYEDRALSAADFNNDGKDAGEIGSGHTVTAFYEVVPRDARDADRPSDRAPRFEALGVDPLRYRQVNAPGSPISNELLDLKIRFKDPEGSASRLIEVPLVDRGGQFEKASPDFRFAAAVAAFGMILRDSPYKATASWSMVRSIAAGSKGSDRSGYREEFIRLAERASETWPR